MTFTKTVALWGVLASLLLVNGVLSQLLFMPVLGVEAGEMMAGFIAIATIFGVSRWFLAVEPEPPLAKALTVAGLWALLTILFEIGLGRTVRLRGPGIPKYGMWDGSFWFLIVFAMATAPITWLRRSESGKPVPPFLP